MLDQPPSAEQKLYPGSTRAFVPTPVSKGGAHCRACPFFSGDKIRVGKDCVTCPWRFLHSGKQEAGRHRSGILAAFKRHLPSIIGIIHPSDGHPQEEMVPDFGWFRPLQHNILTWVTYWPDLMV